MVGWWGRGAGAVVGYECGRIRVGRRVTPPHEPRAAPAVDAGDHCHGARGRASHQLVRRRPVDNDETYDIALPRREKSTGAGHRDFDVDFDPEVPVEDDLIRRDFTVNAIAPGPIWTEAHERSGETEEMMAEQAAGLPLKRFGYVEEVSPAAVLLAASPDGDYYTGITFHPNGGDVMI